MASWFSIALGPSILALAGCSGGLRLPSYGSVSDFALTDQSNAKFLSANALHGKVWIADFIFTNCAGPCPRMSAQMRQLDTALHDDSFRFVSFTVDPARDTPEVLATYAQRYQAEPGVWYFLTGPQAVLHNLARNVFMLGDVSGDLQHSTRFALIDRQSRVRGYYLTSEDDAIPRLIADAKRVAKERF
jgi:protein SCO1/2